MGFGRVRAGHHEAFEIAHFRDGVAHRARSEGQLEPGDAACVAQARAVVDVVSPDYAANVFLEKVVIFVGGLGARIGCDAVGSETVSQAEEPVCHCGQRLIPGYLAPILRARSRRAMSGRLQSAPDKRICQPGRMAYEIPAEAAFDAQPAVVGRNIERRVRAEDAPAEHVQINPASNATKWTRRPYDGFGLHSRSYLLFNLQSSVHTPSDP